MAISAVVAVGDIADDLVDQIAKRTVELRTGDGQRGCDMGPLVTAEARDRVVGYIAAGEAAGARLVVDGRDHDADADGEAFFVGPSLFDQVSTTCRSTPTRSSVRCCRCSAWTVTPTPWT